MMDTQAQALWLAVRETDWSPISVATFMKMEREAEASCIYAGMCYFIVNVKYESV